MRDVRGFTLIEVIITMAILGILLAIAAMSAGDMLDRYKMQGQTKQIYSDLMNVRVSAMQRNSIFFVDLAANQYSVHEDSWPGPDGNGSPDYGAGQDALVMQKATQYTIVSNPTITGFSFAQNGLVTLATTTVDIISASSSGLRTDCIELSVTRILMGKWNGTTSACITQ